MAVVKEFTIGPAHIRILDDAYKNRTKEEMQGNLDRIYKIAYDSQLAQHMRKLREEEMNKSTK